VYGCFRRLHDHGELVICEHCKTSLLCTLQRRNVTQRECYWCRKNTTRVDGIPAWPEKPKPVPVVSVTRDPAALANIVRQQAGCRGCGESPLDGI
jgi:hypothetical protein